MPTPDIMQAHAYTLCGNSQALHLHASAVKQLARHHKRVPRSEGGEQQSRGWRITLLRAVMKEKNSSQPSLPVHQSSGKREWQAEYGKWHSNTPRVNASCDKKHTGKCGKKDERG